MFQRVLICTDFTDGMYRLAGLVPSLAASGITRLVFLHTVPLTENREIPRPDVNKIEQARDRLSIALQDVPDGVEVKVDVQSGKPSEHISSAAKAFDADLIMLGMPGRSLLTEKLFGSTTINLCQRISIPVMTLRPQLISTYTIEELDLRCRHLFRYLLIPYDGSSSSEFLVEEIKRYAQTRPPHSLEQCLLYWVVDDTGRREILNEAKFQEAEKKLVSVKAELEALGLQVTTQVSRGEPVPEVLKAAEDYDISAIAGSSATLGKLIEWSIPSFTGEILRRSWHPVLYFPPNKK